MLRYSEFILENHDDRFDDDHYYHTTSSSNLKSIRKHGLHSRNAGKNFGFKSNKVHLASSPKEAKYWHDEIKKKHKDVTLLRTPKHKHPDAEDGYVKDEKQVKHVSPYDLEHHHPKHGWKPLIEID
jgi:hypothetical protein